MSIFANGPEISEVYANGHLIDEVYANGQLVYRRYFIGQHTITSNANNLNLIQIADGISGNEVIITINPGVIVSSTSPSTPAVIIGKSRGRKVTLVNNGEIRGKGGTGGNGGRYNTPTLGGNVSATYGGTGGDAIKVTSECTIDNRGFIKAGGGGGGGGGSAVVKQGGIWYYTYGGGGGGGATYGAGGKKGGDRAHDGYSKEGLGHGGSGYHPEATASSGGDGGDYGQYGSTGDTPRAIASASADYHSSGAGGGAPGKAVRGNNLVHWKGNWTSHVIGAKVN